MNMNMILIIILIIIIIITVLLIVKNNTEHFSSNNKIINNIKLEFKGLNLRQNNFKQIFVKGLNSYNNSDLLKPFINEKNTIIENNIVKLNLNQNNEPFSKKFVSDVEQLKYNILNIPSSITGNSNEKRAFKDLKLLHFGINLYLNNNKVIKCYRVGCHHGDTEKYLSNKNKKACRFPNYWCNRINSRLEQYN